MTFHKTLLIILLVVHCRCLTAQKTKCTLIDERTNHPIPYASILNISDGSFTYSDNEGSFELSITDKDSLEIRHLSYSSLKTSTIDDTIYLQPKIQFLDEVIVSIGDEPLVTIAYNNKKNKQFGVAMNSEYAFPISGNETNSKIVRIEIPIKIRKEYPSEGLVLIQLYKSTKEGGLGSQVISELLEMDASSLGKQKSMIFNFNNPVTFPQEDFYLVLKRVVTNKIFENRKESYSVNPFIYITEGSEKLMSFERLFVDSNWIKTSVRFTKPIMVNLKIYTQKE
ncbi:MAG: hypothetical protein AAF616_02760 [Bacteroidota bacterium]